jgi:hypothetical protein
VRPGALHDAEGDDVDESGDDEEVGDEISDRKVPERDDGRRATSPRGSRLAALTVFASPRP